LQNFKMLLAICQKKLAIFASTGNYFRPIGGWAQVSGSGQLVITSSIVAVSTAVSGYPESETTNIQSPPISTDLSDTSLTQLCRKASFISHEAHQSIYIFDGRTFKIHVVGSH